MDRVREAADIILAVKQFESNIILPGEFITKVCHYFDLIKNEKLSDADKKFLLFLSNKVGVPHYYDMLNNFNSKGDLDIENIGLNSFSSILYESTLYTDRVSKIHRYQKEILNKFLIGSKNRYFLSASTSFGKTFLVYEIIKKIKYNNIVLIFPTIALLAENLEKLKEEKNYKYFSEYTINTLSDVVDENITEKNIFIFTPERFLSFLDKNAEKINFDFIFVDEVYKIDNDYLIEQESRENERDLAYRMAVSSALSIYKNIDVLLAGPYINFYGDNNSSFNLFLEDFNIEVIDKNEYEIVNKEIYSVSSSTKVDNYDFNLIKSNSNKRDKLEVVLKDVLKNKENLIVYCYSRASAESNALNMIQLGLNNDYDYSKYETFISHLESRYNPNWSIIKALKFGIGIHHGLVPKYIQKEIIDLFNNGMIDILFSTTTITEGVNTSAKNIFIFNYKKGTKILQPFDAKNIAGRAGRFLYHYSGRVFYIEEEFNKILNSTSNVIKHKNYDINSKKGDIDIDITYDEYLSEEQKSKKHEVDELQKKLGIPENIMRQFKVISRSDKIYMYQQISKLSVKQHKSINSLISKINSENIKIDFDGLQLILNLLQPKIKDKNLKIRIERKTPIINREGVKKEYSWLIFSINKYLSHGFVALCKSDLEYKLDKLSENNPEYKSGKISKEEKNKKEEQCINNSMRDVSNLVYSVFKYQLVKYLGIFNVMYKFEKSKRLKKDMDEVRGIDRLLSKLEYNAFSLEAKLASDYGVTDNIIKYYDSSPEYRESIKFDNFEKDLLAKVKKIIKNGS